MIILAKVKLNKEYINKKISNCQRLVDEAIDDAQKEAYQYFLELWVNKLPESQRPETIAKKEAEELAKVFEERLIAEETEAIEAIEAEKALEAERLAKEKAEKVAELKAKIKELEGGTILEPGETVKPETIEAVEIAKKVIETIIEKDLAERHPEPEELNEANFEKEFPNKKAYRTQNGERIETIAFTEYLNKKESE